jgi:hypothetical protein
MPRKDFESDSLDRVEHLLEIEDALTERIRNDPSLSAAQQEALIRELEARTDAGFFTEGDGWDGDDDALALLVCKLGPNGPPGKLGAAVRPESEPADTDRETWA